MARYLSPVQPNTGTCRTYHKYTLLLGLNFSWESRTELNVISGCETVSQQRTETFPSINFFSFFMALSLANKIDATLEPDTKHLYASSSISLSLPVVRGFWLGNPLSSKLLAWDDPLKDYSTHQACWSCSLQDFYLAQVRQELRLYSHQTVCSILIKS